MCELCAWSRILVVDIFCVIVRHRAATVAAAAGSQSAKSTVSHDLSGFCVVDRSIMEKQWRRRDFGQWVVVMCLSVVIV